MLSSYSNSNALCTSVTFTTAFLYILYLNTLWLEVFSGSTEFTNQIWGKSVKWFMSYDRTNNQTNKQTNRDYNFIHMKSDAVPLNVDNVSHCNTKLCLGNRNKGKGNGAGLAWERKWRWSGMRKPVALLCRPVH